MPTCKHCGDYETEDSINSHEQNCPENPLNQILRKHGEETWDGEQKYCKCVVCGKRGVTTQMVADRWTTPQQERMAFRCKWCAATELQRDDLRKSGELEPNCV